MNKVRFFPLLLLSHVFLSLECLSHCSAVGWITESNGGDDGKGQKPMKEMGYKVGSVVMAMCYSWSGAGLEF